eukprot:GHVS01028644.1.p1 GENE.GHVS01028644.1~~GHVS01028644.1.p1  ORF type:complete len:375 (+),score=56.02 GHVS01028644.1:234-1358(+)
MKVKDFVLLLDNVQAKLSTTESDCNSSTSAGAVPSPDSLEIVLQEAEDVCHRAVRYECFYVFGELRDHPLWQKLEGLLRQTGNCVGPQPWRNLRSRYESLVNLLDLFCYGDASWLVCKCGEHKQAFESKATVTDGQVIDLRPYRLAEGKQTNRSRSSNRESSDEYDVVWLDAPEIRKLEILSIASRASLSASLPFSAVEESLQWHAINNRCVSVEGPPRAHDAASTHPKIAASRSADDTNDTNMVEEQGGEGMDAENRCARPPPVGCRLDGSACCLRPGVDYVRDRLVECLDRGVVRGTISEGRQCVDVRDCLARDVTEEDVRWEAQQLERFLADVKEVVDDARCAMEISNQQRLQEQQPQTVFSVAGGSSCSH